MSGEQGPSGHPLLLRGRGGGRLGTVGALCPCPSAEPQGHPRVLCASDAQRRELHPAPEGGRSLCLSPQPSMQGGPQPGSRDAQSFPAQLLFCFNKSAALGLVGPLARGVQGQAGLAAGCREGNVLGGLPEAKPAVVKTHSLRKAPWQGRAAGRAARLMLCPVRPALPKLCQTHGCCC